MRSTYDDEADALYVCLKEGVKLTDLIERFGLDRFRSHLERLEASRFSALGPAGGTS